MAKLDILKQAGMSAIGMVEKAIIEIEDNRVSKINVAETGDGQFSASAIAGKNSGKNMGKNLGKFTKNEVTVIKKSLMDMSRLDGEAKTKRYKVRFNPSTLSLSAYGGGRVAKTSFDGQNAKIVYEGMDSTISLNVQLIFDAESNEDCFMNEITDIKGIAKKGINTIKKKRYSVQSQVEGFIAALRSPYTRRVRFVWGKFSYKGVLSNIDSEYTMFSIHGRPVRAVVNIGINCTDEDVVHDNMGQWEESFENAFSNKDKTNLESVSQNVGNLINFNL